jgi:hypothetical protein
MGYALHKTTGVLDKSADVNKLKGNSNYVLLTRTVIADRPKIAAIDALLAAGVPSKHIKNADTMPVEMDAAEKVARDATLAPKPPPTHPSAELTKAKAGTATPVEEGKLWEYMEKKKFL